MLKESLIKLLFDRARVCVCVCVWVFWGNWCLFQRPTGYYNLFLDGRQLDINEQTMGWRCFAVFFYRAKPKEDQARCLFYVIADQPREMNRETHGDQCAKHKRLHKHSATIAFYIRHKNPSIRARTLTPQCTHSVLTTRTHHTPQAPNTYTHHTHSLSSQTLDTQKMSVIAIHAIRKRRCEIRKLNLTMNLQGTHTHTHTRAHTPTDKLHKRSRYTDAWRVHTSNMVSSDVLCVFV